MKTELLYFLNKLIGRGDEFLLKTMIRCETNMFFNHELELSGFWNKFPYPYVNSLKVRAFGNINFQLDKEISILEKILAEKTA